MRLSQFGFEVQGFGIRVSNSRLEALEYVLEAVRTLNPQPDH